MVEKVEYQHDNIRVSIGQAIEKIADSTGYFDLLDTAEEIIAEETTTDWQVTIVPNKDLLSEYYGDAADGIGKILLRASRRSDIKVAGKFIDLHIKKKYKVDINARNTG